LLGAAADAHAAKKRLLALTCVAGSLVTVLLGTWFIDAVHLTGLVSGDARNIQNVVGGGIDLQGLVLAGLIIGALGVLDDVTVSQASTVFTIHDTDPQLAFGQVFRSAMKAGRDHIRYFMST
jgi:uncharacterized membrane protein